MNSVTLNQFLVLYTWFPLAVLLVFMLLIGRFYERFSNRRTFFRLYVVPLVLYGAAAAHDASIMSLAGDTIGDVLSALAGVVLVALSIFLYRRMMTERSES